MVVVVVVVVMVVDWSQRTGRDGSGNLGSGGGGVGGGGGGGGGSGGGGGAGGCGGERAVAVVVVVVFTKVPSICGVASGSAGPGGSEAPTSRDNCAAAVVNSNLVGLSCCHAHGGLHEDEQPGEKERHGVHAAAALAGHRARDRGPRNVVVSLDYHQPLCRYEGKFVMAHTQLHRQNWRVRLTRPAHTHSHIGSRSYPARRRARRPVPEPRPSRRHGARFLVAYLATHAPG